jgi:hypothetical protein
MIRPKALEAHLALTAATVETTSVFYARPGTARSRNVAIKVTPRLTLSSNYPDGCGRIGSAKASGCGSD